MFRNFITLAYRHFVRSPVTSFIELFGLTAAMTMSILILLWVKNELSYDKFNENYDHIYRLEMAGPNVQNRSTMGIWAMPLIENGVREVEVISRYYYAPKEQFVVEEQDHSPQFFDWEVLYADNDMFNRQRRKFKKVNIMRILWNPFT